MHKFRVVTNKADYDNGNIISSTTENGIVEDLTEIERQERMDVTTKKALIDARLGQGAFRVRVLERWENCCCVTGSKLQAAVRASHIKPWRHSTNAERLDSDNGLPLIANLDSLFDAGLISFDLSGNLIMVLPAFVWVILPR